MNCSEIKNYVIDYVIEELDPDLQIQVNEHLAICEKCRSEVQQTELAIDGFKDATRFKPATDVYRKIAEQIEVPRSKRPRLLGMPRNLVYAFGAFVLGIVITRSVDNIILGVRGPSRIEVRQESPRRVPFSDTVEFYSVPAKNLARI